MCVCVCVHVYVKLGWQGTCPFSQGFTSVCVCVCVGGGGGGGGGGRDVPTYLPVCWDGSPDESVWDGRASR